MKSGTLNLFLLYILIGTQASASLPNRSKVIKVKAE